MKDGTRKELGELSDVVVRDCGCEAAGGVVSTKSSKGLQEHDFGMDGMAFLWCHWVKAFCRIFQISCLEGKILFCNDPVAIEVSAGDGSVKESPSRWRWVEVDSGVGVV